MITYVEAKYATEKHVVDYVNALIERDILWKRMVEIKQPTLEDFINIIICPFAFTFFIYEDDRIIAECTMDNIRGRSAMPHFSMHPEMFGRTVQIANDALTFIFGLKSKKGGPWVNTLIGVTPANNRLALKFTKRCGYKIVATIPDVYYLARTDEYVDGVLSIRRRDQ